jgi:hypothetical protein
MGPLNCTAAGVRRLLEGAKDKRLAIAGPRTTIQKSFAVTRLKMPTVL